MHSIADYTIGFLFGWVDGEAKVIREETVLASVARVSSDALVRAANSRREVI